MEDDLRARFGDGVSDRLGIGDVPENRPIVEGQALEMVGIGGDRVGVARHLRPQAGEPERQPGALEPGIAGDEDPFARIGRAQTLGRNHHIFHGAVPLSHIPLSCLNSRIVSIGSQKPS